MARNKRYRTYPFPFLSEYTDDYLKTQFNLDVNFISEKSEIKLEIVYSINNNEIIELIKNGSIRVVAKISCVPMGFCRTVEFLPNTTKLDVSYDTMLLEGDVFITAYLVSEKELSILNDDLSDFWKDEKTIIEEHNIIGESNERLITVTHAKAGSSKSVFKFIENRKKQKEDPYSVELNNDDCIVFSLSKETFDGFRNIRNTKKEYIYSLYIIPCIADIFRQMINPPVPEGQELEENEFNIRHCNKRWYVVLQDKYQKAFGFNPTEGRKAPLEAAQIIIDKYTVVNMLAKARKEKQ